MIRVKVERDRKGRIGFFRVDGHAGFAETGQDIVCAAVSILVQNAVNSSEALLGVQLPAVSRDGLVECRVPALSEPVSGQLQLLLESMVFGLHALADEYPQYVRVTDRDSIEG